MLNNKTFIIDKNFNMSALINSLNTYFGKYNKIESRCDKIINGFLIQLFPKHTLGKLFNLNSVLHIYISNINNKLFVSTRTSKLISSEFSKIDGPNTNTTVNNWNYSPNIKDLFLFLENYISTKVSVPYIQTSMSIIANAAYDINCFNCNYINPKNSIFCIKCGVNLYNECSICGNLLHLPSTRCPKCGNNN